MRQCSTACGNKRHYTSVLIMLAFVVFAISLLVPSSVNARSGGYDVFPSVLSLTVDAQYYYLSDDNHRLSIDDVLNDFDPAYWHYKESAKLDWGYSDATKWYRFDLNAYQLKNLHYVLEVVSPFMDSIEFFHARYDEYDQPYVFNYSKGGDLVPVEEKYVNGRHPIFPVELEPNSRNTIVLKVRTKSALILPINIIELKTYQEGEQKLQALYGLLFGIMLVMAIYNSVIWVFLKEKTFFYYVLYVVFALGYQLSMSGFGARYLWGGNEWLLQNGVMFLVCAAFMFGGLFIIHYLSLKKNAPRLYRLAIFQVRLYSVVGLFSIFAPESFLIPILQPIGLVACGLVLYTTAYLWYQGNIWAKYLTIAWVALVIGTIIYILMLTGVIDRTPVTEYMQSVGFAIEVSLLSLALGARMNQERQAKKIAMETALELAHRVNTANQEKLIIQRQANLELEDKVDQKTAELRNALQKLSTVNRQLEAVSVRDQLTGLYNRRFFDDYFPKQYRNCSMLSKPISVLAIDIDYFKAINDSHGHLAGDECLKTIAKVISSTNQREDDKIVRFGGEEFLVVLPNTDTPGANSVAERIRELVEKTLFVTNGKRIPLTISVGVAAIVPNSEEPPESILIKADQALYEAKKSGRNCVRTA